MNRPEDSQRVVDPTGALNVVHVGVRGSRLRDLYLSLLVSSWWRLLIVLVALFVTTNSMFAVLYLLGGDNIENARPGSFADAFFFSVQTMATIGYGKMVPHTLWANVLVTIESLVGLLGIALVTGLTFAKFSRPTARVLFSRVAVVTRRDGVPCLMFRMANQRGNQIVEARIHVVLALTETTEEGEVIRRLHDLHVPRAQNALFALSWTAIHPLTESSPLFHATPKSLADAEAEIIISLTGLDESFAQTVHARHSYVVSDIRWNARFVDILSRTRDGRRSVNYAHFHDTVQSDT
ncbi:MAG: ATP-sensitive inward rectifier potassium channel 10 [Deltaproteobacteria bacterium]|nr:ATP-sensitive inward rectifier potassium channel 10 [Deltaproteobacteria bacterium]MBI3386934.1 ATP-sensitive inward rectifier potassium channel 10 [Deltaproteobacteria bacterium]